MKEKRRFDIIRMPAHSDRYIYAATMILAIFGAIMVVSASMGKAIGNNYLLITAIKMIAFVGAGYAAMIFMARHFSFEFVKKNIIIITFATFGALILCLFFDGSGGAKAWIPIPLGVAEVTIQPSEFAKISVILLIACYFCDIDKVFPGKFRGIWDMSGVALVILAIYMVIIAVMQSDFGSAVVLLIIACACFMVPRNKTLRFWQGLLLILLFAGVVLYIFMFFTPIGDTIIRHLPLQEYQINRILSAINPFIDQYNTGYQLINGLVAFASGGFTGVGFGNSVRKYTNFPACNTDFILSIIVEELGIPGFLIIAVCYMLIIIRLYKHAFKMKSEKGRCVLIGVAMYLFIHFFFNVGGVTGLIPLTGVPLLMISSGGSSTISCMMALGIAQAIISQESEGGLK